MTMWQIILAASIACLAFKVFGYAIPAHWLERPMTSRVANLLTVALLAALVAVQTLGSGQHLVVDARVPAILVSAVLYALKVPFIVVVIAAAVVAALLRLWLGLV